MAKKSLKSELFMSKCSYF